VRKSAGDEPFRRAIVFMIGRRILNAESIQTTQEIRMAKAKSAVPEGHHTVTPTLVLDDCAAAIDWYKQGLGATETARSSGPDGKIMHAVIKVGDSLIMMHDAMMGARGPKALGGSPASLWIYVQDCDALFDRGVSAGAQVTRPLADQFWGDRCGTFTDPHGFSWTIATRIEDLTREEVDQRAAEFFKTFAEQNPSPKTATAGA
jgi:PhnB protein